MNISINWLKDYIDLDDLGIDEVAQNLTMLGLEVEAVEYPADFSSVVVGKVLSVEAIPNNKNKKCLVDVGSGRLNIVCGAPNVRAGVLAPVVKPGGKLPGGHNIGEITIAGAKSQGMICSLAELGLGTDQSGIWILDGEKSPAGDYRLGDDVSKHYPQDAVFKIEVTHNRGDCLGHIGVARDLAAGLGRDLRSPKFELIEDDRPASDIASVDILDAVRCPRYGGRVILGAEIKPSPVWMQCRLLAVGMRPISNVVDVTNYVMMEYGHPLHAFDLRMLAENRIVVKTAKTGENFTTLDEKEHSLVSGDLLICDAEKGVALAGVMGGLNSEIKDDTSDILLECAYFHPVSVRKTAKRLGISTDSSYRFERGVDPNGIPRVIDRTACLIQQTANGRILKGIVDNYARVIKPKAIELRPERVNFVLGGDIPREKMVDYLVRLELDVKELTDMLLVTPPTFRPDLTGEIDLVEEIARIDGYDNIIPATHSSVALEVQPLGEEDFDREVRMAMITEGLQEVLTHSMRHPQRTGIMDHEPLAIRVPISADYSLLRTDLLAPLLETAAFNLRHGAESIRIFELGHVFRKTADGHTESKQIAGLMIGAEGEVHWKYKTTETDIFIVKGMLENLLTSISLDKYSFSSYFDSKVFSNAQKIVTADKEAGIFGEISRPVLDRYEIDKPVFFFVLDYDILVNSRGREKKFREFSRFPAVKRDLSFTLKETVSAAEIEELVKENGSKYLQSLEFFDLYRGKQVGEGKKSVSISL